MYMCICILKRVHLYFRVARYERVKQKVVKSLHEVDHCSLTSDLWTVIICTFYYLIHEDGELFRLAVLQRDVLLDISSLCCNSSTSNCISSSKHF